MNVFLKQLMILFIGNLLISTIICDDTLELSCSSDDDCKSFENKFVSSECNENECVCLDRKDESWLECSPKISSVHNEFVRPKACTGYNTEMKNGVCRTRVVSIGRYCEEHLQCLRNDWNAECIDNICTCKDHYMEIENICRSVIKIDKCTKTEQCPEHAECLKGKCLCNKEYVSSKDYTKCLPFRAFNETCVEEAQCSSAIGLNADCVDNICQCKRKYFVFQKGEDIYCVKKGAIGDPCESNSDCFNDEFRLFCTDNICTCKIGFDPESNMPIEVCQRRYAKALEHKSNGAASIKVFNMFSVIIVFSVLFAL